MLTVSGERERPPTDEGAESYVRERFYGAFRRSVTLPAGTDDDRIDAYFGNGLVEIVVPGGAAPRESRRIPLRERPSAP